MVTRPFPPAPILLFISLYLLLRAGSTYSDRDISTATPDSGKQPGKDEGEGRNASVPVAPSQQRSFGKDPHNGTFLIPDINSYSQTELYALLVDILERLEVLVPQTTSCYQLEKVKREVLSPSREESSSSTGSTGHKPSFRLLGIYLQFKESPLPSSTTPGETDGSQGNRTDAVNSGAGGAYKLTPQDRASNECVSEPLKINSSLDPQPLLNGTNGGQVSNKGNHSIDVGAGRQTGNDGDKDEDDEKLGGLSRTQVVVISTCSGIICLFFIVAFVLRVRNYIKRVREEQLQAQRPTFRSCSVRLRSVSHSNDQMRRDSQVSKLSHQSNLTGRVPGYGVSNGSTSRDHSNASSPHHDPDTKPLLMVTAAAEGGEPQSPSDSQSSSLQFIDEEPRKKSERSASRTMVLDDSEARPLLTSSEISANSLHLSPTSPTSAISLSYPAYAFQNRACVPHDLTAASCQVEGDISVHLENIPSTQEQEAYLQKVPDAQNPQQEALETALEPSAVSVIQEGSGGPSDANGLPAIPLIRFWGLTQSDSSLSSTDGGRDYGYGTQTEYVPPSLGYFPCMGYINGINCPYYSLNFLRQPRPVIPNPHNYFQPKATSFDDDEWFLVSRTPTALKHEGVVDELSQDLLEQQSTAVDVVDRDLTARENELHNRSLENHLDFSRPESCTTSESNSAALPSLPELHSADSSVCDKLSVRSVGQAPLDHQEKRDSCEEFPQCLTDPDLTSEAEKRSDSCDSSSGRKVNAEFGAKNSMDMSLPSEQEKEDAHLPTHLSLSPASVSASHSSGQDAHYQDRSQTHDHVTRDDKVLRPLLDIRGSQFTQAEDQSRDNGGESRGSGDQSQNKPSSASTVMPDITVVMKRLFPLHDDRTTFL